MSIPYISLDTFPAQSGSATLTGGAWLGTLSANDARFSTTTMYPPCGDVPRCIYMWANTRAAQETYSMKYETNISIPMSRYGNANQLSFNWSYKIRWGCSLLPAGYGLTSFSRVGSSDANAYSTDFTSTDWATVATSNDWATTITHSGTTPIERYGGSSLGFVYISIDLSMPHPLNSSVAYYIKAATFDITTPTSIATASTAISTSGAATSSVNRTSTSSSSTLSSSVSFSSIIGGLGDDASPASSTAASVGSAGGTTGSSDTLTRKNNLTPAIIGATLGAIALLGLIGFFIFLKRRIRRNDEQTNAEIKSNENAPPIMTNRSGSLLLADPSVPYGPRPTSSRWDTNTSSYITIENDTPADESGDVVLSSNSHRQNPSNSYEMNNVRPGSPSRTEQGGRGIAGSVVGTEAPPPYRGSVGISIALGPSSRAHPTSLLLPVTAQTLEGFARVHRVEISESLERKLERANYLPSDDPDEISEEAWAREYAVDARELDVLRRLYHRNNDA